MEQQVVQKGLQKTTNLITAVCIVALLFFVIYGIQTKLFYSKIALETFLDQFGIWAPIIFIIFQAVTVIFPVLPSGIGTLGGIFIFGPVMGFVYNYTGICLGSIAAFLIAKQYGPPIIEVLFSSKLQRKYMCWAEDKNFTNLFAIAIFMPVAPDDFLCYLAGTTKMKLERFTRIILLGKPLPMAICVFELNLILQQIVLLFQ